MPVFEIDVSERYPDFSLRQTDKPASVEKEICYSGGWMLRTRIELTEDEFNDWCRVLNEYETWMDRFADMGRLRIEQNVARKMR